MVLRKNLQGETVQDFDFLVAQDTVNEISRILSSEIVLKQSFKFSLVLTINFIKYDIDGEINAKSSPCFTSQPAFLNNVSTFNTANIIANSVGEIQKRYDDFVGKGSGWTLQGLKFCDLHITKTNDLRGGCKYSAFGNFNEIITRRAGLLSINNEDERCLLFCIAASFTNTSALAGDERSSPFTYIDFVNLIKTNDNGNEILFPVRLGDIGELERINRKGISPIPFRVNVFMEDRESKKLFLVRSSSYEDGKIINVLLVEFNIDQKEYWHYLLIEKTSFFKKRYVSSRGNVSYSKTLYCQICFTHFRSENQLKNHEKICGKQTHAKVFPSPEQTISFTNHEYNFKRIFTGYADFESVLKERKHKQNCTKCTASQVDTTDGGNCDHSYITPIKTHVAISVAFVVVDRYGSLVHEYSYTGNDVVVQFIKELLKCEQILVNTTKFNKYMIFDKKDRDSFSQATVCHICNNKRKNKDSPGNPFTKEDPKVRDHDHLTGKYIGPAHNSCNLNKRREKPFLSIFMHNFSGYDSHLILPFLTKKLLPEVRSVGVIPKSGEKFMQININKQISILDSMSFLAGSLDSLNERIKDSCEYKIIKQSTLMCQSGEYIGTSKRLQYLLRKGVFPYEWAKRLEDYSAPCLVPKTAFYNSITMTDISDESYRMAEEIWEEFNMKSMKDFLEIYCMTDTLILAQVFEEFRKESMENFSMDPSHFISLPGFAYKAFLKQTEVNLDYITDVEMFDMLSTNLRGGHSFCSQRYEESSLFKHLVTKQCEIDSTKEEQQHILYLDANNLYGSAQMFKIPQGQFKFLTEDERHNIDWVSIDLKGDTGYFVEVDIDYPESIWEQTKDFPLAPENIDITHDMLSPFQKAALKNIYNKATYRQRKLTATFLPRKKMLLHGLLLQLFLQLGMKLKHVYRVISFTQGNFMNEWVQYCTRKRSAARNEFEKAFWKLIVNAVYGKTIERLEDRECVKICRSKEDLLQAVSKPDYKRQIIINEELVIVCSRRSLVYYDKPYYIGFSILEVSRYIMYNYFYNVLRKYFVDHRKLQLLYSDTDSLILKIITNNLIEDLKNLKPTLDFSNLPKNHPLYDASCKSKLFYFKEEFALLPVLRIVSLGSKVYATETVCCSDYNRHKGDDCDKNPSSGKLYGNVICNEKLVLKGITKIAKNNFAFHDYLSCLTGQISKRALEYRIQSKKQIISSTVTKKIALAGFSDKRYILDCGIHSRPYSIDRSSKCYANECIV